MIPRFLIFYFWPSECAVLILCLSKGEDVKVGDIPKPSLPSILPKKPLPSKTNTSPLSLPPRRPERPPSMASVHAQTQTCSYGKSPIYVWKYMVWRCCMVYLPRCESTKSEGGALTSDSGFDRSHDTGESLIQWNEDMSLQWLAVRWLLSVSLGTCGAQPAKDYLFLFIVICRRWPGCSRLIDWKAESSNSVAATGHRPPASLTDHHTSELFCQQSVMKKIWLVWNSHQCYAKCSKLWDGMVVQWLAQLPHSRKVSVWIFLPVWVVSGYSSFLPLSKDKASLVHYSKLTVGANVGVNACLFVSVLQPFDKLATSPWCILPSPYDCLNM